MTEAPTLSALWAARELFFDPIACAAVAGAVLGFLGVYVLWARMAFVSAAATQAAGLGVALAFYAEIHLGMQLDPGAAAIAFALLATWGLALALRRAPASDGVLALAFVLCSGLAVVVASRIAQEAHDVQAILLGSAVLVRRSDLVLLAGATALVMVPHVIGFRALVFASVDPEGARVQRLPVAVLTGFVLSSTGLLVGVSVRALGALPVLALSTLPAMAALWLPADTRWTFAIAAALGVLAGAGGYVVAFLLDLPVGATQAVVAAALPALAAAAARVRRASGGVP